MNDGRNILIGDEVLEKEPDTEVSNPPLNDDKDKKKNINGFLLIGIIVIILVLVFVVIKLINKDEEEKETNIEPTSEEKMILSSTCSDLSETGFYYSSNSDVKCDEFVCTLKRNGRVITRDCKTGNVSGSKE